MRPPISQPMLHQFITGASVGDAITTHTLDIQRWLREMGFVSEIYAEFVDEKMLEQVRPLSAYRRARHEQFVIYHHSLGSNVTPFLINQSLTLLLIYHNVTPPEFFSHASPAWVQRAQQGQAQLHQLRPYTRLALADSPFNEQDLLAAGYTTTGVLPITLTPTAYDLPLLPELAAQLQEDGPNLLFVGRLSPNKKQEDLVKLLYYLKRIRPTTRLFLVGDRWTVGYDRWVERLAAEFGLAEAVTLTDKVSQQEMVTYYRTADLYISMSEHEGFGKPLIESMYLGLPVLAFACTSVPDTVGGAGVLFHRKDFLKLAELVDIFLANEPWRQRQIARQKQWVAAFLEPHVQQMFGHYLTLFGELDETGIA